MRDAWMWPFPSDHPPNVGDLIEIDGKVHKVTRKGSTAIAAQRYFWFDALADWMRKKLKGKNANDSRTDSQLDPERRRGQLGYYGQR